MAQSRYEDDLGGGEMLVVMLAALALFGLGFWVGQEQAPADAPKAPIVLPAPVQAPRQDLDETCAAWLFEADLARAKRRICGTPKR